MNSQFLEMILMATSERFSLTTEKTVELQGDDRPCQFVIKRASYGVMTNPDYPKEFLPAHTWAGPGETHRIIKNNRSGDRYMLVALDKSQGYGSSEFINPDTGEIYRKYEIKQWLPVQSFDGPCTLFPVKMESIKGCICLANPTTVVETVADKGDELPF